MNEITIGELWTKRAALEKDAATQLGYFLFEISRLEMNLDLCLVWVDGGSSVERLTNEFGTKTFGRKLTQLGEYVAREVPAHLEQRAAYETWIQRADALRDMRNRFVHGRWSVDPLNSKLINVVGVPTSSTIQNFEYTIDELSQINDDVRGLQLELHRLRKIWPL